MKFDDDHVSGRIIEHIIVAYLFDLEDLNQKKSLINFLLAKGTPRNLSTIISFIWRSGKETYKKNKEKIEKKKNII